MQYFVRWYFECEKKKKKYDDMYLCVCLSMYVRQCCDLIMLGGGEDKNML